MPDIRVPPEVIGLVVLPPLGVRAGRVGSRVRGYRGGGGGVILGGLAPRLTNAGIRLLLAAVSGTVIFLLESVVFSLIGLQLPGLIRRLSASWLIPALAITATLLVVRVLWVFPLAAWRRQRHREGGGRWQVPAVVSWAGARGVVPLAATLSIPLYDATGAPLPHRDLVLLLATAVIVISLVVQGFTLAPLVRLAGLAVPHEDSRDEHAAASRRVVAAGMAHLDDLAASGAAPPAAAVERVRRYLEARAEDSPEPAGDDRRIRRAVVAAQGAELGRLVADGSIGEATRRRIQRQLDLEDELLAGED
jgi:CPA1 family monovalent cation:H+ antiporter